MKALEMSARKFFNILTNIVGVDFSLSFVRNAWVIIYQLGNISFGLYISFYQKFIHLSEYKKNIYSIIDIFQVELLLIMQIIFLIRALKLKKLQGKILDDIRSLVEVNSEISTGEKKFLRNFIIIIITRVAKLALQTNVVNRIYFTKTLFSELTFALNDFMFQYYLSLLIDHLRIVKCKLVSTKKNDNVELLRKELLENFWIKRGIRKRYSFELFVTVLYNFFQLIVALYWIFMRIKFNHLKTTQSELVKFKDE